MNRQVLSVASDRPTVPSRVITLSQAPALAPWLLSRHSPGLVFILAQHHRPGDARRLVRQRNGDDQRRSPPTQPDHPRIGEKRDELATLHSITSSAQRAWQGLGVRPRAANLAAGQRQLYRTFFRYSRARGKTDRTPQGSRADDCAFGGSLGCSDWHGSIPRDGDGGAPLGSHASVIPD